VATVQVFTKERMLAIENGTIVSGTVNSSGRLILTRHDGSTYDAGIVYPIAATVDVSGLVELATSVETIAGSDTTRAVTPSGLAALTATTDRRGLVELATQAETVSALDASRAVTPLGLFAARQTFSGIIDPTWSGSGNTAPVILDANQGDSGTKTAFIDPHDYKIEPGVVVIVSRIGQDGSATWFVDRAYPAFAKYAKQIPIDLQNGWALYNDINELNDSYGAPRYQVGAYLANGKLSSFAGQIHTTMSRYGVVRLHGLIQTLNSAPLAGSIIAQLPVGMRPSYEQEYNILNGNSLVTIFVGTDGYIRYNGGTVATWFSLNNIRFRAKSAVDLGLATFKSLVPYLGSGWAAYTGARYSGAPTAHPPGYTIDPDGVVIFEGMIVATAAYTANAVMGTLTDMPFNYPGASHHLVVSPGVSVRAFRFGTNSITPLTGTKQFNMSQSLAVGQTVVLSQVSLVDPNKIPFIGINGANSWVGYGSNWRNPGYSVTPDRQVFLFGLWTGGIMGNHMALGISSQIRPRYNEIFASIGTDVGMRLDVQNGGNILPNSGTPTWVSLDGVDYSSFLIKGY